MRIKASGVPNPLPPEFMAVADGNRVLGDQAKYIRISGERRTAKRSKYGAPAIRRSLRDIGDARVRCLYNFESFSIEMTMLMKLMAFERYAQDEGMDWVRYQIEEAARRQQNTRIITTLSALANGAIYWDGDGNLLPNSSGANTDFTVDFAIPATHKNQCNGNIPASWALVNTDIPDAINRLQLFSLDETGMEFTACLYGKNVSKYIRQNSFCQTFLSRNETWNGKLTKTNEIPDGLFGLQWKPMWKSLYETDDNGTVANMWPDDLAVFVPNVDQPEKMTWWAMFEGSIPVPKTIDVQRDPLAAIRGAEIVYGMGSYSAVSLAPLAAEVYHFDVFLPAIRNEKAIFLATVAF